jgi:hypothetical protein
MLLLLFQPSWELAESLGAFYRRTDVTMLRDPGQNDLSYPGFIACGLTFEALPMGWFTGMEHCYDISNPFHSDLEGHFKELGEDSSADSGGLVATARTALRTTCAKWSSRLDQELFNGRRGSFLRMSPLL